MRVSLLSLDEGHSVWELPVRELPIRIGRDPDVEFRLDDDSVSDFHCLLDEINGVLWVRDLGSEEGTFVNGFHVAQSVLMPGDRLTVGERDFEVVYQWKHEPIGEKIFA
jgi:pSer/pThr/pTyr-binding forkhead associated (FHA) protein